MVQNKNVSDIEVQGHSLAREESFYEKSLKSDNDLVEIKNVLDNVSDDAEELEPDVAELPKVVREIVPMEDDPSIPVFTFRYVILSIIFVSPGAFISTLNSYRTTSAAYSIFFVQICSHWLGKWLARFLPKKRINIPGTKYGFDLNPGPWSIKETVLITITASSGATGSLATNTFSLGELYFDTKVNAAAAIFFMWAIVWVGYSYAALARNFLIYDPIFTWPQALMQTALCQTFKRADEDSKKGKRQVTVFFCALVGMTIWQFFPEYIFPFTSSLAFLCWVAPRNATANFIGAGMGGMGFLNLTLDWSNITSNIMISPYWVQVVQFIGFVFGAWVLIPAAKWGNLASFKHGLMSNGIFQSNGTSYPGAALLTADHQFNQTAYDLYGPVHIGTQRAWNTFFDYASYTSGILWAVLFGYEGLKGTVFKVIQHHKDQSAQRKQGNKSTSIHDQYTDRLNKLQSNYDEVPVWWFVILFFASFIILITVTATGAIPLPWWAVLLGLGFGAVIVIPLAWLYAFSNFQLAIGTANELIMGSIINATHSHRNGMTSSLYGCIAGDTWYRCQYFLVDQKFGFYNGVSPKLIFMSQLFGILISVPINYGCMVYVLTNKREYLDGTKHDPLGQWTGQTIRGYYTDAIQYVVLGPKRLFSEYPALPYGFLVGVAGPVLLRTLHWFFPKSKLKFHLWNTTVFFSTMSSFYGNLSTGYLSQFIGGTITMYWVFRHKHSLWKNYNYIVAAALDTGYNLCVLLIFIIFNSGKAINMPNWWGNNDDSVERCFALE